MKWELLTWHEATNEETCTVNHTYYTDFNNARNAFFDTVNNSKILSAVVYAYIGHHAPSIVLAYNNDWNEDFIANPSWVDN